MKFLFFLLSISWCSIPLTLHPSTGEYFVGMVWDNMPNLPTDFVPFMGSHSVIYREAGTLDSPRLLNSIARFTTTNHSINIENLAAFRYVRGVARYRNWVAFGPGSDLVNQYQSVDVIRDANNSRLLLSSSEEVFVRDHCLADSIIRLRHSVIGTTISVDGYSISRTNLRTVTFSANSNVLGLPNLDFETKFRGVMHLITGHSSNNMTIDDCSSVRESLPEISLSFIPAGQLVFYPSDYLQTAENNVCKLLIQVWEGSDGIQLNPLRVPGINIRATSTEVLFCDSQNL